MGCMDDVFYKICHTFWWLPTFNDRTSGVGGHGRSCAELIISKISDRRIDAASFKTKDLLSLIKVVNVVAVSAPLLTTISDS